MDDWEWDLGAQLQAITIDAIRHLEYAVVHVLTGKGKEPKPMPRPGVDDATTSDRRVDADAMPVEDMIKALGWDKPPPP